MGGQPAERVTHLLHFHLRVTDFVHKQSHICFIGRATSNQAHAPYALMRGNQVLADKNTPQAHAVRFT